MKKVEQMFRQGTVAREIVKKASRKAISRGKLVSLVANKTGKSERTIQAEISYLMDPANIRNNNRVKLDGRLTTGRVRLIAA